MISKFIGGILLIVGTSIGAGMLALPIANAEIGFWYSSLWLCGCWMLMTTGAFLLLEVTLYLPPGTHMVSMAAATIGKSGLLITWITYLLLLYALLCAYISGATDVLQGLLGKMALSPCAGALAIGFTLIFGLIVYRGIREVDWVNRILMFAKLGIYLLLVVFITPYVKPGLLKAIPEQAMHHSVMILITSFGYGIIIPNLRDYFNNDIKKLKKVILIGSLIPLICYIIWNAIIAGALPAHGNNGLISLIHSHQATSTLANLLTYTVQNPMISGLFNAFTSICMLTAFLGVSLSLMSFLSDGLKFQQSGKEGMTLFVLTFLPPLLMVIWFPGAYLFALNYAGYLCVVLLLILPALMVCYGRKHFHKKQHRNLPHWAPYIVIICSLALTLMTL